MGDVFGDVLDVAAAGVLDPILDLVFASGRVISC
jgi:hypothetical protein